MALITDYASLISEVKLWLNDSSTSDDTVKGWIQLAEDNLRMELATLDDEERTRATVPSGGFIALPDFFNGLREAYIIDSPNRPLVFISPAQMTDLRITNGRAFYISIQDGQFKFSPNAEGEVIEVIYFRKLPRLSDTDTTNSLLINTPSVYLSATLSVAQKFLRDDTDAAQHIALVAGFIDTIKRQDQRRKFSGQGKVVGVNPVVSRLR